MAQNPLLGNRISLISKKNIRYEGTLYSINEANATVALQNVRSYGTEGREETDAETTFVAPQDQVHPYLLFRGCDIKDLHVHEASTEKPTTDDPAILSAGAPPAGDLPVPPPPPPQLRSAPPAVYKDTKKAENENRSASSKPPPQQQTQGGRGAQSRRPRKPNPANQVGTGASLLNRKARGTVEGVGPDTFDEEFDFQSKLEEFEKEGDENDDDYDDEAGDAPEGHAAYEKDDFFDSISCDALDKERGLDNRLRGANERNLNTETFGAVALNSQRRRRGGRGGGRGDGGRDGRGGGRGRGRGRGRGGRGGRGRGRGRYSESTGVPTASS